MRTDIPGSSDWIEHREPAQLTIGDIDAFNEPLEAMFDADAEAAARAPEGEEPAERKTIPLAVIGARRTALLGELITGWSFGVPLPYTAASRRLLPAVAGITLNDIADAAVQAISDLSGPKATPGASEASGGSASTSPGESESAPPVSAPEPSGTAGG
jgi:hypothetical protein